jgi:phosphotriesterase-related protein
MTDVMTVTGPVKAEELGVTSIHEHVYADLSVWLTEPTTDEEEAVASQPLSLELLGSLRRNFNLSADNYLLTDIGSSVLDLQSFVQYGGRTIVDLTTRGLAPEPRVVRAASYMSGALIVMGCGYYIDATHPPGMDLLPVEAIHDQLIQQIESGIDGTDVRPGIIGEIGTSERITRNEEKVLRAAGRAQRDTGLAVNVHLAGFSPQALQALSILEAEGADPGRTVLSHLDHGPLDSELHLEIARRGAFVAYDGFGKDGWYLDPVNRRFPSDGERVEAVLTMLAAGHGDRLMIACDVCSKMQLTTYGGWGYQHLVRNVTSMLERAGVDQDVLTQLLAENPRRLLAGA